MAAASLGTQLHEVRKMRNWSLKTVAEPAGISAAYLQKLERDDVKQPSPHVLHALAEVLSVPYEKLMELAGYVVPAGDKSKVKPGSVLAYALSSEKISEDEAEALARYLRWYREDQAHSGKAT
ncbi:MAG: helix-turn-helix domain-containing protein [Actinomycetota bacterium]|nr:helix-turn-helix domain-containing protein [Actinomycetota bacterium]